MGCCCFEIKENDKQNLVLYQEKKAIKQISDLATENVQSIEEISNQSTPVVIFFKQNDNRKPILNHLINKQKKSIISV